MKQFLFILSFFLVAGSLSAQQQWTVSYQKKIRLKNAEENTTANILSVKRKAMSGNLAISFKVNDGTVNRTVMADDSSRSGIKGWENVNKTLTISAAELKKLVKGRDKILFYFTEIPKDPEKAALVRMRPVHLFTLLIK